MRPSRSNTQTSDWVVSVRILANDSPTSNARGSVGSSMRRVRVAHGVFRVSRPRSGGNSPSMATPDRIADPWGPRSPYGRGESWPARPDAHLAEGASPERWVPSASLLHSHGDGIDIAVEDGRIVGVRGRPQSRVNRGRLGPKDMYGWQANHSPDRLTRPLVRRDGALAATDWDTAMDAVVGRCRELLDEQGPSAIGFYTTGQLFIEHYYTLGLIAHGGIGTNHVDGNTRLCTATAAAALKETFASDGQPGSYTDVDHADVIALYGHNALRPQHGRDP